MRSSQKKLWPVNSPLNIPASVPRWGLAENHSRMMALEVERGKKPPPPSAPPIFDWGSSEIGGRPKARGVKMDSAALDSTAKMTCSVEKTWSPLWTSQPADSAVSL